MPWAVDPTTDTAVTTLDRTVTTGEESSGWSMMMIGSRATRIYLSPTVGTSTGRSRSAVTTTVPRRPGHPLPIASTSCRRSTAGSPPPHPIPAHQRKHPDDPHHLPRSERSVDLDVRHDDQHRSWWRWCGHRPSPHDVSPTTSVPRRAPTSIRVHPGHELGYPIPPAAGSAASPSSARPGRRRRSPGAGPPCTAGSSPPDLNDMFPMACSDLHRDGVVGLISCPCLTRPVTSATRT